MLTHHRNIYYDASNRHLGRQTIQLQAVRRIGVSKLLSRMLGVAAAVMALVLAMGAWTSHGGARPAAAGSDPLATVQAAIDAANASLTGEDATPFAAHFTEGAFFEIIEDGSFAFVGRDAIASGLSSQPGEADTNFHVTLVSSQVNGNTVTGVFNVTDRDSVAAGVDRYVQPFTAVVDGGLIASLRLRLDTSDAQTATYLAYVQSQPGDDGGLPPDTVQIDMAGDQPGSASVGHFDDSTTFVIVNIEPGAEGAIQPAHIHTGTCASPGPIVYPLASVVDGNSFTQFSVPPGDLLSNNYIVNVHLSEVAIGTYVSCARLEAPPAPTATAPASTATAPAPTATAPASAAIAPAPTATPLPSLGNTGTGGARDNSAALPWLLLGIAALGAAGGAGFVLMRRRS
jgi:hypothetical protein